MNMPVKQGLGALSEKEKQTLRLIVRGHDAKSVARSLDLSVHTINERLRDARRKLAVSSSREAARLLLEAEGGLVAPPPPDFLGDARIGEDAGRSGLDRDGAPSGGAGWRQRRVWILIGVFFMPLILGLLALGAMPQVASTAAPTAAMEATVPDPQIVDSARQWLALLDQSRWDESYRATGTPFRKLNTAKVWADTSEQVRAPLGRMLSRAVLSQENLPAPPSGYEVVKFRTSFANKADAIETVTLDREGAVWRVVGVTIK